MRLKCIRLAGFKSFVDPTTVNFPSNMAAVVGPNGCGKSNIIDAVRWVMGESSAKNLRGESMTDVIFNGSSGRKPISQASIELVFDNSETTLVGEYAAYAGAAQLLDHRTGHDLQADRGQARRVAQFHRGSRRHLQIQGAPPRNREPYPPHPGKPGTPDRPA